MALKHQNSKSNSSIGQFWYWKFDIFLFLENQVSRSFAGSYSSTSGHSPLFLYVFGSHWILRVSFLKVLQPFRKSDFLAIPGNVLQNLQVIRTFSYTSQAKSESHESWNSLLTFFSAATAAFGFTLTVTSLTRRTGVYYFNIINGWRFWLLTCICQWGKADDRNCSYGHQLYPSDLWQRYYYHPSSVQSLILSTAGTFSHVYVYTQHINKDQYQFYALNFLDFTLLSSAKMLITKIESMTENYPEFPVANLNYMYAGGHAGHQI